jgi:hypothetical protein
MVAYLDRTSEGEQFRRALPKNLIGEAESYLAKHPEYRANPALLEELITPDEKRILAEGRRKAAAKANPQTPAEPPVTSHTNPTTYSSSVGPRRSPPPSGGPAAGAGASDPEPAGGMFSSALPGADGGSAPARSEESVQRQQSKLSGARSAAGGAKALGGALADGTRQAESLPGGAGKTGPGPGRGGPGGAGGAGAPGGTGTSDPSRPATAADLALAAGPYRPAFDAAGLRVDTRGGVTTVRHADGSPATAAETSALSAAIGRMPTAAMRDPSYLNPGAGGISWSDFQGLKTSYEARPDLKNTDFKHIALTDDKRDFKRSESCDRLSGECNEHAEASYKRGDDVPAKDLGSIWTKINKYLNEASSRNASVPAARAARSTKGIWARIAAVFGGGGGPSAAPAVSAAGGVESRAATDERPAASPEAAAPAPAAAPEGAPAPEEPARGRSGLTGVLVGLGAVCLAVPVMRSKWAREI